jgi:hypothetical protein
MSGKAIAIDRNLVASRVKGASEKQNGLSGNS